MKPKGILMSAPIVIASLREKDPKTQTRAHGGDWMNAIYPVSHKDASTGEWCQSVYREVQEEDLIPVKSHEK